MVVHYSVSFTTARQGGRAEDLRGPFCKVRRVTAAVD